MDDASEDDVGRVAALLQDARPGPQAGRSMEGLEGAAPGKPLTAAAERALAEAAARREALDRDAAALAAKPEVNGRGGLEPVLYSDWEVEGRAVDF